MKLQPLVAIDQLFNALLGGWADETLSARSYRMANKKMRWTIARYLIDKLFFWQENHCKGAYMSEMKRNGLPPEYRETPLDTILDKPLHNPFPHLLCQFLDTIGIRDCPHKKKETT